VKKPVSKFAFQMQPAALRSGISLEACEKLGPEFGVFGVCMVGT
jgi:hypothetical protein